MPCFPLKALVAILKNGRQSFQQNSEKKHIFLIFNVFGHAIHDFYVS